MHQVRRIPPFFPLAPVPLSSPQLPPAPSPTPAAPASAGRAPPGAPGASCHCRAPAPEGRGKSKPPHIEGVGETLLPAPHPSLPASQQRPVGRLVVPASRKARGTARRGAARGAPPPGGIDGSGEGPGEPRSPGELASDSSEREKRNKAPEREREKNGKIIKTNKQNRTSAKLNSPGDPASTLRRGPWRGGRRGRGTNSGHPRGRARPAAQRGALRGKPGPSRPVPAARWGATGGGERPQAPPLFALPVALGGTSGKVVQVGTKLGAILSPLQTLTAGSERNYLYCCS